MAVLAIAAPASAQSNCVKRSNIEAIIDDSPSMLDNDPNRLRVQAMNLLIDKQGNEGLTLGAVEFGFEANDVFGVAPIGPSRGAMKSQLDSLVRGDNNGTDYNAGFDRANAHNLNANARIFLTDGEHIAGEYRDGHRANGGPPTYVIGFSTAATVPENQARLQRIADETSGRYFRQDDASTLAATMNDIDAIFQCAPVPARKPATFTNVGQTKTQATNVPAGTKTVELVTSWASSQSKFSIGNIRIVRNGRTVGKAGTAAVRKLKISRRSGATFTSIRIKNPVRGKLKYRLRASQLGFSSDAGKTITQVTKAR